MTQASTHARPIVKGPRSGIAAAAGALSMVVVACAAWAQTRDVPAVARPAAASLVRVTCRGVQRLVLAAVAVECAEAGVLDGPGAGVLPFGTSARAALPEGSLLVEAAGGAYRGAGSVASEAGALLRTAVRFVGEIRGERVVRVRLRVRYRFSGYGEAGVEARLRTSVGGPPGTGDRVRTRLEHRGLSGVRVVAVERRGRVSGPAVGPYPSGSSITMVSIVPVEDASTRLVLRGDLTARSLGNLRVLEPSSAATASASATLAFVVPCGLRAYTDAGRALRETFAGRAPAEGPAGAAAPCLRTLALPVQEHK